MDDITFDVGDGCFLYTVRAIIIKDDCVLMVKNESSPYYYSVGGRVKLGETSETAVLRETYEETNLVFEIDRLAFIHENFFVSSLFSRESCPCHEIGFFYLMKPHEDIGSIICNSVAEGGAEESLHWLPIDKLSEYPIFPVFYKSRLNELSDKVGHIVTRGDAVDSVSIHTSWRKS